jgi:hypothetical protein
MQKLIYKLIYMSFEKKYLKYKDKYLTLKSMIGGMDWQSSERGKAEMARLEESLNSRPIPISDEAKSKILEKARKFNNWYCNECYYLNSPEAKICSDCEAVKEDVPKLDLFFEYKEKGWYCETCRELNTKPENKICVYCDTVRKDFLPDTPEEKEKRIEFIRALNIYSDAKYLRKGFRYVAVPKIKSLTYSPMKWFQRKWIELSENNKKRIRELYSDQYRFDISISSDIRNGNRVVFYLVEPLTKISAKYGHSLEEALRIIHENDEFIRDIFQYDYTYKSERKR